MKTSRHGKAWILYKTNRYPSTSNHLLSIQNPRKSRDAIKEFLMQLFIDSEFDIEVKLDYKKHGLKNIIAPIETSSSQVHIGLDFNFHAIYGIITEVHEAHLMVYNHNAWPNPDDIYKPLTHDHTFKILFT